MCICGIILKYKAVCACTVGEALLRIPYFFLAKYAVCSYENNFITLLWILFNTSKNWVSFTLNLAFQVFKTCFRLRVAFKCISVVSKLFVRDLCKTTDIPCSCVKYWELKLAGERADLGADYGYKSP